MSLVRFHGVTVAHWTLNPKIRVRISVEPGFFLQNGNLMFCPFYVFHYKNALNQNLEKIFLIYLFCNISNEKAACMCVFLCVCVNYNTFSSFSNLTQEECVRWKGKRKRFSVMFILIF